MIAYRAMVDVPRELVQYLGGLLAAGRRARRTRTLTRFYQALLVLVWFRKGEDLTLLGAGFGISRATAYRYHDEGIAVLAAQTTDLAILGLSRVCRCLVACRRARRGAGFLRVAGRA